MSTGQDQERALEVDTRTKSETRDDPAAKVYMALTVGVAVAAFTVSIRLPDACFDGEEAIVVAYAAVQSVFFLFVPAVLGFGYVMKQNCYCPCKSQYKFPGRSQCCGIMRSMLRFAFYYYPEIVPMTILGVGILCGNIWKMDVFRRCLQESSATLETSTHMGKALIGFEFIYMISEFFFIFATVLMMVTIWLDNPEPPISRSESTNSVEAPQSINTPESNNTVEISRSINTSESNNTVETSNASELKKVWVKVKSVCCHCFLPFDRFLLGYYVISILIMLVSTAADEGAQETTFSAFRKCNNTFSSNMSQCALEKIDEWTNNIFTPLKVQFCFVTLMILVSVLMKNTSSRNRSSCDEIPSNFIWCIIIFGIIFGVLSFAAYGWISICVITTSNSTTNATDLTMSPNTSFDKLSLYLLLSRSNSNYMNEIKVFVIAQVVYQVVLFVAACFTVYVTVKNCTLKEKQDSSLLKGSNINDVIVILTSNAVTIHCVFNLVSFVECKHHNDCGLTQEGIINWQIASLSLDIAEGLLQACLLLILNSRHPIEVKKTDKTCQKFVYGIALFFLSLTNLAIGLGDCLLELREARSARGYLIDYSYPTESWTFVTQAYYPLGVYFRLYSANAFWKRGVKLLNYDNQ